MAFWLAKARNGQAQSTIQRFDPRFWTVNFPRPMMAATVATGPDSLRVDCDFYHEGELAGLIWESEDRFDHPLLAYQTVRDYSHCRLEFRWRSSGIIPLSSGQGPTLTIEGRDQYGARRIWYVRLWNYASGTGEDAHISLPFSELESGFFLPGEKIDPRNIERMFISLIPPGYSAWSSTPFPQRKSGWLELSGITCEGDNALLNIGDCLLPPHDEQLATAYDDSYNLDPARLLRMARGLGYRGRIVHYVGMSHYFRLEPLGGGHYISLAGGVLNQPCEAWHRAFAAQAKVSGYEIIWSLSYELFDAHCWNDWKQRSHNGAPALTGWSPPSTLLSPAHSGAMSYLRMVAGAFVEIAQTAGMAVVFQIGEPWWWVNPDGAICLYDNAARAALGGAPAIITDMRAPLSAAQKAVLDDAGEILAQSTAALAAAVKSAAGGAAETMLLIFAPTILSPDMPELRRANLPSGWAYPAYERLQVEDYDWLTDGSAALRQQAYEAIDAHLQYPLEYQDYLAGFVLQAEDADRHWRRIDAGLEEAEQRGINERYVWALPQIARDGYTRLPALAKDDDMLAFDDVLYPLALGEDTGVSPEFVTSVAVTASGHERRSTLWADARMRYDVGPGVRSEQELGVLLAFFRARRGAARGFRLRDPYDFSSRNMTDSPTPLDQLIGTGDGETSTFALVKHYGSGPEPQQRTITRPQPGSIRVSIAGEEAEGWSLGDGGSIHFTNPPPAGAAIRAGFLFDVPVRFAEDTLDISGAAFAAGEAPSVPLIEIKEAL